MHDMAKANVVIDSRHAAMHNSEPNLQKRRPASTLTFLVLEMTSILRLLIFDVCIE